MPRDNRVRVDGSEPADFTALRGRFWERVVKSLDMAFEYFRRQVLRTSGSPVKTRNQGEHHDQQVSTARRVRG
jgi:hypothetical protein